VNTRKVMWDILIAGAIWVTLDAAVYTVTTIAGMSQPLQPSYGQQSWLSLVGFYSLLQILLGFLVFAVVLAHPVGVWSRSAHRQVVRKRLSAEPVQHGKYFLWGRNLRRHPSIPARYSGLRPRKRLRPLRRPAQ